MNAPVPMFPLPGLYLLPGTLVPLHIFEPRYRQMVADLLDSEGNLIIATIDDPAEESIRPMAGLGRLENYHRLDDGRYIIIICGLARVTVSEVESDRLYRQAEFELVDEIPEPPAQSQELREALIQAIQERADSDFELPEEASVGQLADLLLLYLDLPQGAMGELYSCVEVAERARAVLDACEGGD